MNYDKRPLSAGLHFVATPIGSARDITLRGLDILASADLIMAEDTRTARKLMDIHGIPLEGRQVVAYHDHSGDGPRNRALGVIGEGKSVAYVSEAGTPLVADPGYALGRAVIEAGLSVYAAPGPSAVLAALTVSGLPTDRFAFIGFLPSAEAARQTAISNLRDVDMTLVFYESPKRVREMLEDLSQILGSSRQGVVCRELTKKFEEVRRGTLAELTDELEAKPVKGEVVVLVGRGVSEGLSETELEDVLREAMKTMRVKDAATMVAGAHGLPRRQVYQLALGLDREE